MSTKQVLILLQWGWLIVGWILLGILCLLHLQHRLGYLPVGCFGVAAGCGLVSFFGTGHEK